MTAMFAQSDVLHIPLPDQSVDFVFGSPPYRKARLYLENGVDLGIARDTDEWVEWMLAVTTEALRVSKGCVVWIAAGSTEDRNYQPTCEGLMWEWHRRGGHAYRPCYWHRVGIPGSGGDQWFRADVEHAICFKRPGALPWTDSTAMGHPADWPTGGPMSYRDKNGVRRNTLTVTTGYNGGDASTRRVDRKVCEIANPGNLIQTTTGGGKLGHPLAHENEAPFPEALAEFFIRSLCPPGGITLDPFSGSGTTVSVAARNGRHGIGFDLRRSQCELGTRRTAEQLLDMERPHRPKARAVDDQTERMPLFA
jgi:hypothetical protein